MGNGTSSLRNGQSFLLKSLCETSRFARNGFLAPETKTAVNNNGFRSVSVSTTFSPRNASFRHISGNIGYEIMFLAHNP